MKKTPNMIIIALATLALTGCGVMVPLTSGSGKKIDPNKPWTNGVTIQGNPLEIDISEETLNEYSSKMKQGKALAEEAKDYDTFVKLQKDIYEFYDLCVQAYKTNSLKYDVYGTEEDQKQYLRYSAFATEIEQWINDVYHICAKNDFRNKFFDELSDEEIEELIGLDLPQEFYDAQNRINELVAEFGNLEGDKNYLKNVDVLYKQLHEAEKTIATCTGYNNYLEYAYDNVYARDYTPADTDAFFENVYKYACPEYISKCIEVGLQKAGINTKETKLFQKILYGDAFTECFNYIEDYKDFYGGYLKQEFDGLFTENGHYNISYEEDGYDGAYEDEFKYGDKTFNYVYYGPRYHSSITIMHEFGHYLAAQANPLMINSFDLAETQSQANEFMFLQYLRQSDKYDFSNNLKNFFVDYYYADDITAIIIPAAVNEVEKIVYSKDYELGDLEKAVNQLYTKYPDLNDIYDKNNLLYYCANVAMESAGYYISYATSAVGAFYINRIASEDFNAAKQAYNKIINLDGNFTYFKAYEYAGLGNPFEEQTFEYIFG